MVCRRDDWAFLPPGTVGGVPCAGVAAPNVTSTGGAGPDPHQVALAMWDQMAMPNLQLDFNPRRGMVAVPTWFWVDGYDGAVLPLSNTLHFSEQRCSRTTDPTTGEARQACSSIPHSLTVVVRAWPRLYTWDFGDGGPGEQLGCGAVAACPIGLGRPFTDVQSPSPIAHAYQWSSLGINGAADAYTVRLVITFGAQFQFSRDGAPMSGWQELGDRALTWTAAHQVQEAQSVLAAQ